MDIFEARFSTDQAVKASGAGFENVQNWIKRDKLRGMDKIGGGGSQGRHRRFSFNGVMEIGIVAELRRVGFGDLDAAFEVAYLFAHFGAGPKGFVRQPGCPWPGEGKTLILVGPKGHFIEYITEATTAFHLWQLMYECGKGCVMIDAGWVFDRVIHGLGYNIAEVRAYLRTALKER